jgi:hypothetical protein
MGKKRELASLYFTFLVVLFKYEFEHLDILPPLQLIWPHSRSHFHTLFGDLDSQHYPLAKFMLCVCLVKNSSQTPVGKRVSEKSASHASITLHLLAR